MDTATHTPDSLIAKSEVSPIHNQRRRRQGNGRSAARDSCESAIRPIRLHLRAFLLKVERFSFSVPSGGGSRRVATRSLTMNTHRGTVGRIQLCSYLMESRRDFVGDGGCRFLSERLPGNFHFASPMEGARSGNGIALVCNADIWRSDSGSLGAKEVCLVTQSEELCDFFITARPICFRSHGIHHDPSGASRYSLGFLWKRVFGRRNRFRLFIFLCLFSCAVGSERTATRPVTHTAG